jgi:hypothetical protein
VRATADVRKSRLAPANKQGGRQRETDRYIVGEYPVESPFLTIDALHDYFSQSRITCLLCGRKMHVLGKHLVSVHGVTSDQYREKYGIPWSYGLCSPSAANNYSKALKKRIESGDTSLADSELLNSVRTVGKRGSVRPRANVTQQLIMAGVAKVNPRVHVEADGRIWSEGPSPESLKHSSQRHK